LVLPRKFYATGVRVARAGATQIAREQKRLIAAVKKSAQAEPAVAVNGMSAGADQAVCTFSVEAADVGHAVMIALAVVQAAQDSGWSWDGWHLAGAVVTAALESSG
jgi:hypothetical protein